MWGRGKEGQCWVLKMRFFTFPIVCEVLHLSFLVGQLASVEIVAFKRDPSMID